MNNKKTLEKIEEILINVDEGKLSNSKGIIEIMNVINGWRGVIIKSKIIDTKDIKKVKKKNKSKKGWGRSYGY